MPFFYYVLMYFICYAYVIVFLLTFADQLLLDETEY